MNKITFENLPSTNTPLNATNMNLLQDNVEDAIDDLTPVLLYENSTGTQGNVTLSDSLANYSYIEIYYAQGSSYGCSKFNDPNGKEITIFHRNMYDATHIHNLVKNYSLSGTTMTVLRGASSIDTIGSTIGTYTASTSIITVFKVIGYK